MNLVNANGSKSLISREILRMPLMISQTSSKIFRRSTQKKLRKKRKRRWSVKSRKLSKILSAGGQTAMEETENALRGKERKQCTHAGIRMA